MFLFIYLISSFWFIRQLKSIFFWLYLWQLKEYHTGRFFDHFRTDKGKKIFLNRLFISKIALLSYALILSLYLKLLPWYFYAIWVFILIFFYLFESIKFVVDIIQKKAKRPILTQKTIVLILANLILVILFVPFLFKKTDFIYWFSFGLLSFDILSPFLVSGIVLLFQPITVLLRNRIIKKAKEKRARFKDLIVIGITGSYGKTSTKEFLAAILSEKFGENKVLKTKEHQNSEVGISQCILNDLKPEHEIFIVEMGAYNRGGIKLLCDIARPQHGILTGINEQHMATFGSLENIIKTKYELVESLPGMGFIVFNGDNEYCRQLYKKAQISKRICYTKFFASASEVVAGDYWVENIKAEKDFLSFKVFSRWGEIVQFQVNLLGEHWAQNILMAAVIAKEIFGMSLEEISRACQKINPEQTGMKLIKGFGDLNIIGATYSANPDGVISHLEYLNIWPGTKIIIMPCLIELGRASGEVHYRIGQKIGEVCHLAIITTKERFQDIRDGAMEKGMPSGNILFMENPKKIFEKIKSFCRSGDIILLESRVPDELVKKLLGRRN